MILYHLQDDSETSTRSVRQNAFDDWTLSDLLIFTSPLNGTKRTGLFAEHAHAWKQTAHENHHEDFESRMESDARLLARTSVRTTHEDPGIYRLGLRQVWGFYVHYCSWVCKLFYYLLFYPCLVCILCMVDVIAIVEMLP